MLPDMSFSANDYIISVNKNISPLKLHINNKSGYSKALLAHEIKHIEKICTIVRLKGAYFLKTQEDNDCFFNYKKYNLAEKTLVGITPF